LHSELLYFRTTHVFAKILSHFFNKEITPSCRCNYLDNLGTIPYGKVSLFY